MTRGAIAYPGTSLEFKTGSWRVQRPEHRHGAAPCHTACPAGEDAQAYLALVEEGRFRAAWETIVAANPLPAVTGRVCHHPCERSCNRAEYDEAIAIHDVERFLGDQALQEGWAYPVNAPPASAPQVAVVGAGPAGCSAAYHLVRLGYQARLFDALPEAGGLLRTALPSYRLPRDVLDREIERLLASGIQFSPGDRLGRDFSLDELRADYKAVFLAPGTQRALEWSIGGQTPRDLHVGLDLLKQWLSVGSIPTWRSVAIVGGGNTSVDLARVLKRVGVPEVHIITHQSIPRADTAGGPDVMPAIDREVRQGLEEGIVIHEHRGVQRLVLRGEQVIGVELVHMKKLPDATGERRFVTFEGTESLLHVEQVIPAIGQVLDPTGLEKIAKHKGFLEADAWGRISGYDGLLVGGDARGDRGTVSEAIGDGRRGAAAIHNLLQSAGELQETERAPIGYERLNLNYYEPAARPEAPVLPVAERTAYEEIEGGLSRHQVMGEGKRCFSCGSCLACDNCWTLCPDVAVLKTQETVEDGSRYVFDYSYCKGCGLCAHECPSGYIVMRDEI